MTPGRSLTTLSELVRKTARAAPLPVEPVRMAFDPHRRILYTSNEATSDRGARLAAWADLVGGKYTLVVREQRRPGERIYLLLENAPDGRARRRLTGMEAAVVGAAARALPGKMIAYSLGIAPSTVSMTLSSATAKLGLESPTELARVVRVLVEEATRIDDGALSVAEREVLALLLAGKSNRQIARARRRSERTVANQVAAILRKTGCPSRRALRVLADGRQSPIEAMTIETATSTGYREPQKRERGT